MRRVAVILAVSFVCLDARADDEQRMAEDLFNQGLAAMAASPPDYPRACRLFEGSYKIDPSKQGTLLNLAGCHEQIGKVATAWSEYRKVEGMAAATNRTDRVKLARERWQALEPRLSYLKIVILPSVWLPSMTVAVDGVAVPAAVIDVDAGPKASRMVSLAVDPGTHQIVARAPGKRDFVTKALVDDARQTVSVQILALVDAPPGERTASSGPGGGAGGKEGIAFDQAERVASSRAQRTAGLVVGGVGVATLLTGGVFGILAVGQASNVAECSGPAGCVGTRLQDAESAHTRANTFANVANVLVPLGLVFGGVGAALFFTAKGGGKDDSKHARTHLSPVAGPGALGLSAGGAF